MAKNSNSGVEGASGYTFQRCCIVYLLFDEFEKLNSAEYFVCVEHHEDFLFAFLDEDGLLRNIDTYQAKKSRDDWKTDQELCDIIGKITLVGKELIDDNHPKATCYKHTLNFLTNKNISLKNKKEPKKKSISEKVQVSNNLVNYINLHDEIKSHITSKLIDGELADIKQLDNLRFKFIDLPQSNRGWQHNLTGLSAQVLGNNVNDHEAVITTLMKLLQDIELTYNNNELVSLSDKKKQLPKSKIDETFNMLSKSKKSFDFWREYSDELSRALELKLPIKRQAKELLDNCFDFFKDIQQIEYKKIYRFVAERVDIDARHSNEVDCIVELYHIYISKYKPRLDNHMVAFAIIAAYVETRGMYA
ncbi:hypothetical protein H8I69_15000 [Serratia fonticola]|uniref:hypothetical protein n=1 Tax=Serratia fonticola TaxID=47917 RepID=UPI0015C62CE2|nr:hypothetical protein [Serratia fonticola]MBC3380423.1 hypothetical protein [Serratia fonticola]NYA39622.1 hypothetical protein [Serratia fonticola]